MRQKMAKSEGASEKGWLNMKAGVKQKVMKSDGSSDIENGEV
jgi:hypothetical protein